MMSFVVKTNLTIKKILSQAFYLFSYLVPKNKKIWVFGAWDGKLYSDNSKYMFEYVIKTDPRIKPVWITRNKDVLRYVRSIGFQCHMRFSLQGIMYSLRAGVAFIISSELSDISPFINRKRTKTIQLWHGLGPKLEKWKTDKGDLLLSGKSLKRHSEYYWMATSEKYIDVFHDLHSVPRNRFYITGYPRNDTLFYKPVNQWFETLRKQHPSSKFIIYIFSQTFCFTQSGSEFI